jgi:hypothetical protein
MKIFIIVYLAGQFAGAVGPLPMDIDQCRQMAGELVTAEARASYRVALLCRESAERPVR